MWHCNYFPSGRRCISLNLQLWFLASHKPIVCITTHRLSHFTILFNPPPPRSERILENSEEISNWNYTLLWCLNFAKIKSENFGTILLRLDDDLPFRDTFVDNVLPNLTHIQTLFYSPYGTPKNAILFAQPRIATLSATDFIITCILNSQKIEPFNSRMCKSNKSRSLNDHCKQNQFENTKLFLSRSDNSFKSLILLRFIDLYWRTKEFLLFPDSLNLYFFKNIITIHDWPIP